MSLIEDYCLILLEISVALGFCEEDSVGHELDPGVAAKAFFKAHLVTDKAAQRDRQFLCDPPRHACRSDAPGLGAADASAVLAEDFRDHFWQLGGFSRTGFADDHDHLMR